MPSDSQFTIDFTGIRVFDNGVEINSGDVFSMMVLFDGVHFLHRALRYGRSREPACAYAYRLPLCLVLSGPADRP